METFLLVLLSAILLQAVDYMSIRRLSEKRGLENTLAIFPQAILRHPQVHGFIKVGLGLGVGLAYLGLIHTTETLEIWQYYLLIRDLLLGICILALVVSAGIRFLLSTEAIFQFSTERLRYSTEVNLLLFATALIAVLGVFLFFFSRSLLLLGCAVTLFVAFALNRGRGEERHETESKRHGMEKGPKALLSFLILLLTVLAIWQASSSERYWIPSDYHSSRVLTDSSMFVLHSEGLVFEGHREAPVSDVPDSSFVWYSGTGGALERLILSPWEHNRSVTIWNESGNVLSATVQTVYLPTLSLRDCGRISLFRSDFSVRIESENSTAFLGIDKSRGINVTLDLVRGRYRTLAYVSSISSPDSALRLSCRDPTVYLDGNQQNFNGSVGILIRDYQHADFSMTVVEDTSMVVQGTSSYSFPGGMVSIEDVHDTMISSRGIYRLVEGDIWVVGSENIEVSFKAEDFSWRAAQQTVPNTLQVSGGIVYSISGDSGSPLIPVTHSVHLVEPESLRTVIVSLTVIIATCVIVGLILLPGGGTDKDTGETSSSGSGELRLKVLALTFAMAILGVSVQSAVGGASYGYYLSTSPIDIEVWVEEGVNIDLVGGIMDVFLFEAGRFMGITVSSLDYHEIPSDGKEEYTRGDVELWGPPGRRVHDTVLLGSGWSETIHITFLTGKGKGFIGLSNYGASIAILLEGDELPFRVLDTLVHEWGHAMGLPHDIHSRIMTDDHEQTGPLFPQPVHVSSTYKYREANIYDEARNGSLQGFPDWGSLAFSIVNWRIDDERESALNVFLFVNEDTNSLRQLVFKSYLDASGNISESVHIYFAPADWLFWSFSLQERIYILSSSSGGSVISVSEERFP